jgi:hypothetical protein
MAGVVQTPFEAQNWYRRLFGPIAFAATFAYIAYQIYKVNTNKLFNSSTYILILVTEVCRKLVVWCKKTIGGKSFRSS